MPTPSKALIQPQAQDAFSVEKTMIGGVTLLTMQGTLNQAFEGRKIAEAVRTKNVVVDMRKVRRFASWGMSEWMDFLRTNGERELYLVECSTYAVSQMNLVTGLLGHGRLVSFYASFRCTTCGREIETLFVVPRDRDTIRELPGSHQECPSCGGQAGLEEYPAAFFETIAARPPFDIDDEVLAFFQSHFKYELPPDLTRFRARRRVHNGYTYLRLTGSMALLPPEPLAAVSEGAAVVDLAGVIFSPAEMEPWRAYLGAVLPKVTSLQLMNCPSGFLAAGVSISDLQDKLKVRTFTLQYECLRCNMSVPVLVDVAEHLEQLVAGEAPPAQCPSCQSTLVAVPSAGQSMLMRALPARDRDPALDKLLEKVRGEPAEKLENCLAPGRKQAGGGPGRGVYLAVGLSALVVGALAAVALGLWKMRGEPGTGDGSGSGSGSGAVAVTPQPQQPQSQFTRPDWILSDVPSSAYCHEIINRLMCVGVSTYRPTRDDGVAEANDAVLEELVSTLGLKITDPYFRDNVLPGFSTVRAKALSALQAADSDRTSKAYADAAEVVRKARRRVTELLQASGGAAVPSQRSDWYWEEYAGEKGRANETLVFVRYDVTFDAMKALLDKYSASTTVLGGTAMTAFPAVAWQDAELVGGALVTKAGRPLAGAGVTAPSVISAVGDQRVVDAPGLAKRIEEWKQQGSGDLKLTVKTGDAAARTVEIPRQRLR
jgi:DNA-directed RNA polymerase subunit RPC12/RpoP